MRKRNVIFFGVFIFFYTLSAGMPGKTLPENENPKPKIQSVLVICPFPDVAKRKILETAFVKALTKIAGSTSIYPYIGTLSSGEEIKREEFIKRVNEKKIEALLFIQIKGIASNLDNMGGTPDPVSLDNTGQDSYGGVYVPKGRAAKTWYQASLVNFKSGKSLWKKKTKVIGDIWLSLNSISKAMAKKTAKQINKTGLLVSI